jgi:hypothetical protein
VCWCGVELVKENSLRHHAKSEVAETRIDYRAQPQSTPILNVMGLYQVFTSLFNLSLPHGAQVKPLLTGFKVPQGCQGSHAPCNGLGRLVSCSATPSKLSETIARSQVDSDRCKLFTIFLTYKSNLCLFKPAGCILWPGPELTKRNTWVFGGRLVVVGCFGCLFAIPIN